jgi:hypothetical protein
MTDSEWKAFEESFAKDFDKLRGMTLGMLESFNLDPKHERAVVSTFKSFTYDRQKQLLESIKTYLK